MSPTAGKPPCLPKVDYHAVLGLASDVTYTSTLSVAFSAFTLVFGCFIIFVLQLLAPSMFTTPARWLPLAAVTSPVVLLLWPTDSPPLFFFASPGSARARRELVVEVRKERKRAAGPTACAWEVGTKI